MSFKTKTLFKFFGFDVKADISWIFLSVLISWTMATQVFPGLYPDQTMNTYQLMGVATVAGVLFSIIAHEVAHGVIAEYYHMPITSIRLMIFGGVAEMRGEPSHPKGEFLMAIAGPIMSALVGLFFWALAHLYTQYVGGKAVALVFEYLGNLNMLIAAFNILPAFPLDGGRALRAAIWHTKNNFVLATRIASEIGQWFAYSLMGYALYAIIHLDQSVAGIWSGLIGFFVLAANDYAVRNAETRSLLGTETVARFMHNQIVSVSPDLTIAFLVDAYINKHYQRSFPVVDRGLLVGIIHLHSVLALERHKWQWLHVASIMEPLTPQNTVAPDTSAADALDKMRQDGRDIIMVAGEQKLLGVVHFRDLANYLSISMKIDHNRPIELGRKAY